MSEPVDIGHGVTIYFVEYDGARVGLIEEHAGKDGEKCSAYVRLRGPKNAPNPGHDWSIDCADPLTLSPSVLCTTCGHHGFIRDGKWVPA